MNTLKFIYFAVFFFGISLYSAERSREVVVYTHEFPLPWNDWTPILTFAQGPEHIITIWEQKTHEGIIRSFSLSSHLPQDFEWITNPQKTEQRHGPGIYCANGYVAFTSTINEERLQCDEMYNMSQSQLFQLLCIELDHIEKYHQWLKERPWTNLQLIRRLFAWAPDKKLWTLQPDAPNPLLAYELYMLYISKEPTKSKKKQTTV